MADARIRSVVAADLDMSEVIDLYRSVGWTAYLSEPELLPAAMAGSSHIVVARVDAGLVGLARVISDSASIAYLQDVLVRPTHHRQGIGAALVRAVFGPYEHVRQKVLVTDDEPAQRAFYAALGWRSIGEGHPPLRAFVRLDR
jgi:GNAT superfamily N-acetyltransferase